MHPGAGDGGLHDVLGVVGGRVVHRLVLRGHPQGGAVVVGAVVQRGHPAGAGVDRRGDRSRAVGAQDERRGLDLDLEAEPAGRQTGGALVRLAGGDHGLDLADRADLREGDHQAVRQPTGLQQAWSGRGPGSAAPAPGRRLEALEAQPHERRGGTLRPRVGQPSADRDRVGVLDVVGRGARSRPRSPAAGPRSARRPAWPRPVRQPPATDGPAPRPRGTSRPAALCGHQGGGLGPPPLRQVDGVAVGGHVDGVHGLPPSVLPG